MIDVAPPVTRSPADVRSHPRGGGLVSLDPRAQLIGAVLLGLAILVAPWPVGMVLGVVLAAVLVREGRRRHRPWRGVARLAAGAFIIGATLNLLLVREGEILQPLPFGLAVTAGGLARALDIGFRLANLTLLSGVVGLLTRPAEMAEALGAVLGRLDRVFGRGIHAFIFELQLVIRFVPLLEEEGQRVLTSQRLRGLRVEGGPLRRAGQLVPLFIPVLSSTLVRAQNLGLLLAARGYRPGNPRHYLTSARWRRRDTVALMTIGVLLLVLLRGMI